MLTIQDIIDKRRRIWSQKKDLDLDKALVRASAVKILSTPSLVAEVQAKPYLLIEVAFYIVNKKRETVPFFLNEVQRDFVDKLETLGTSKPFFILKGRQQGFTSVITAIQLSYAIGVAKPVSILVNTFGTGKISDSEITEIVKENFDLRPAGIIKAFDLRRPIYKQTAAYGHFGRNDLDLPWEKTDKTDVFKSAIK